MIKKILLFITLFLLLSSSVQAQGTRDLTTCNQATYCEGNKLLFKSNCNRAPQFIKSCNEEPRGCPPASCFCTYEEIGECKDGKPNLPPWANIIGTIETPSQVRSIGFGGGGIGNFLTNIITLLYIVAGIIFVFMIIWGSIQWIMSGGDKEGLDKAKKRITHAIIGLVLLALSFLIIGVIGQITGFTLFVGQPTK